jgi:hypothetical protein
VVDVLMVRAKQQDSIMSCLRNICNPAKIWIPSRESNNKSLFRKLLFMGWTKKVVDNARVTIYNFIRDVVGENIPHPVLTKYLGDLEQTCTINEDWTDNFLPDSGQSA